MNDIVLARLEQVGAMLTEARTAQDVKQIIDMAELVRIHAKRTKMGTDVVNSVTEFQVKAERQLGEVLNAMPMQGPGQYQQKSNGTAEEPLLIPPTLAEIGISKKQSSRAQKLAEITPEALDAHIQKQKQAGDEITVNKLLRDMETEKNKQDREQERIAAAAIPLPANTYRCIVIDPPWQIKKIARELYPNQTVMDYPMMAEDELRQLPVTTLADTDCHLYLWITHKYLPLGLQLAESWGFRYQCVMTWVKNVGFTPFSWMYSTEHVLFCRRGNLDLLQLGRRLDFAAPRREHSRKPDIFYDLVRDVSPGPRLDMFARESRDGFDLWGNDVNHFQPAEQVMYGH